MAFARLMRRLAHLIFWLMSAYLLVALLIALSDQGQPTGELVVTNQAPALYPIWYQDADLLNAGKLGIFLYPAAILLYLFGSLITFLERGEVTYAARRRPAEAAPGLAADAPPPDAAAAPDAAPEAEPDAASEAGPEPAPAFLPESLPESLPQSMMEPARECTPEPSPGPPPPHHPGGLRAPGTLCTIGEDFTILAIGPDAADLFNRRPVQLLTRPLLPLLLPADGPRLQEAVQSAQARPEQVSLLELGLRQPDGAVLRAQVECHILSGPESTQIVLRLLPLPEGSPPGERLAAPPLNARWTG